MRKSRWSFLFFGLAILLALFCATGLGADVVIQNNLGVKLVVPEQANGYALGTIYLNGHMVEKPLLKGMIRFENTKANKEYWLYASKAEKIERTQSAFSGTGTIEGADVTFNVTIETPDDLKAVRISYDFSVSKDIPNVQAALQYNTDFAHSWKCHMYPFAEDSDHIRRDPLSWMGIPSLFMYRKDRKMGMLWGIDPHSDYLNPTTWTKDVGLYFVDGVMPAQFRVGGAGLKNEIHYLCPMQMVLTDVPDPDGMVMDLVDNYKRLNDYTIDSFFVRSHEDALNIFIEGRKNTHYWHPRMGYRDGDDGSNFIYVGTGGMAAYFDYLLYELTGDKMWRQRSFEQMDFILKAQNTNREDPNYGYIQTTYSLSEGYGPSGIGFNSDDRGSNIGWKPDIDAQAVRYMLLMWEKVKEREGIDRRDWYNSAIMAMNWVVRQQNWDGGLPQNIEPTDLEFLRNEAWSGSGQPINVRPAMGKKSVSGTAGRTLPGLATICRITGDPRYKMFAVNLERFTLQHNQYDFYFTGHHPDLPPGDFTEASIWGVTEFWLNRYDETGDESYLRHAEANIALDLIWTCPKQLSWVKNPTQFCAAEQEHYFTYTLFNYQNRKQECLKRLYDITKNPFYAQMYEKTLQEIYFTQTTARDDRMGGTFERTSDPWLARPDKNGKTDFNSLGPHYMNEQSLDCFLQTLLIYRTGKEIYVGESVSNKVYPDGSVYYGKSIEKAEKVNLRVLPSTGTINVVVKDWSETGRKWAEEGLSGSELSATHRVGNLKANAWYEVLVDGKLHGAYQSSADGTTCFSFSGNFGQPRQVEVKPR